MHCKLIYLFVFIFCIVCNVYAKGTDSVDRWKGFERFNVQVNQYKGYYVKPVHALKGNPWVWRSSFPDWHTDMDSILLTKGFHIAYINTDGLYGHPVAMQAWDNFYALLTNNVKLSAKPALEAVSRGALYALAWAKRNPDKVSCIYAETPVYDVKSWPGGKGKGIGDATAWNEFKTVYHFTEEQALAFKDNPIDNLEGLASFKVPVLNVIGLWDNITPLQENAAVFVQRYNALGGPASVIPVTEGPQSMNGHHIPIVQTDKFVDYIISYTADIKAPLPYAQYIKVRSGLNQFKNAVTNRKTVTVAFLGGSITYNPGWRQKVSSYLQELYPQTKFKFIAAGIPSLGSLPHAFRLQQDVLDSGRLDLLFLEAAVNDRVNGTDSLTQVRDLEGIVRHAKKSNPAMDIVMMEFADPYKNQDYDKGITPVEIANHELVATHYGLTSINLAKEVHDKLQNQEFIWDDDFKDLHPSVFGQELYFATIKEMLTMCRNAAPTEKPTLHLPKTLNEHSFINGSYYSIKNAKLDQNWRIDSHWQPADQVFTREGFVNVPVLSTTTPGAKLTLSFKGNAVGMAILSGPDAGAVNYSVDGKPYKHLQLFTPWSNSLHLPWYLLLGSGLKNGTHTLTLIIDQDKPQGSKGTACRIVNFFTNNPE
jgi:sialidase-1